MNAETLLASGFLEGAADAAAAAAAGGLGEILSSPALVDLLDAAGVGAGAGAGAGEDLMGLTSFLVEEGGPEAAAAAF